MRVFFCISFDKFIFLLFFYRHIYYILKIIFKFYFKIIIYLCIRKLDLKGGVLYKWCCTQNLAYSRERETCSLCEERDVTSLYNTIWHSGQLVGHTISKLLRSIGKRSVYLCVSTRWRPQTTADIESRNFDLASTH